MLIGHFYEFFRHFCHFRRLRRFRGIDLANKNRSQVDSPKLTETPEITEITENFTKVTKYLIKIKETLINYV